MSNSRTNRKIGWRTLLLLCNNIVDVLGIVGRSDNNKRPNQKKRMTMAIVPDDRLFVFKIKSQTF